MNPIRILLLFLSLFAIHFCSYSQGKANWWFFGDSAGVSFTSGSPAAVTTGAMYAWEGNATISDNAGNLLFYTNGVKVWNKNHIQMPNGFGLLGNTSTTQTIIVPRPGSSTIYYVFTADAQTGPNGLRYSVVDMLLNGGLGNVTIKNTLLVTPTTEKITAVLHCNRKDIWVIAHDWNSNQFRAYLVTAAGVSAAPVLSSVGTVHTGSNTVTLGYLKGSPDGSRIACAVNDYFFELFDFNNSTGFLSNPIKFTGPFFTTANWNYSFCYGVEFSPDGTKLYLSHGLPQSRIVQINLCAGDNAAIIASGIDIGTSTDNLAALQLGPDNKIYVARFQAPWLGVINNPNATGLACNYVNNGVPLAGKTSLLGLPNFITTYLKPALSFTASINCLQVVFTAPAVNSSNCSGGSNIVVSQLWNFDDPASGVNNTSTTGSLIHTFTNAGTYNVKLVLNYACGADTIIKTVTVNTCGCTLTAQFVKGTADCTGCSCKEWIMINSTGGTSPYSYSWPDGYTNRYRNRLCPGAYSVNIKDKNGCSINLNLIAP